MGEFYRGNGFDEIVDELTIPSTSIFKGKKEKSFKTAWGYSDEYLYKQAIKKADDDYQNKRPFYYHIMTTSNHRPYNYPEGRIDIISHGRNREGALKYTDWSIGNFLKESSKKPWFKNTIFVITADHTKSAAGRVNIPINRYHIPLYIYSADIKPQEINRIYCQLDIPTTILGLLNIPYSSNFFGQDIFRTDYKKPGRAFMGTYQELAYYNGQNNLLTVLKPGKKVEQYKVENNKQKTEKMIKENLNQKDINTIISHYQVASYLYKHHSNHKK